jgi:hypothetical protein
MEVVVHRGGNDVADEWGQEDERDHDVVKLIVFLELEGLSGGSSGISV